MLRNEFGGVNEAFYNLYAITEIGPQKLRSFLRADVLDPLACKEDNLSNKHANTFIPKVIGEARNYEITADERSKRSPCFSGRGLSIIRPIAPAETARKKIHSFG